MLEFLLIKKSKSLTGDMVLPYRRFFGFAPCLPSLAVLLLVLVFPFFSLANGPLDEVLFSGKELSIEGSIQMTPENGSALSPEELSKPEYDRLFYRFSEDSFPTGKSVFWLRFSLKNTSDTSVSLLLGTSKFDFWELFLPDTSNVYHKKYGGLKYPNSKKEILFGVNSYGSMILPAQKTVVCYMRVEYIDRPSLFYQIMPYPVSLISPKVLEKKRNDRLLVMFFYSGAILVMLIYNLFLSIISGEKTYLLYISFLIAQAAFSYYFSGFFVERQYSPEYFEIISSSLASISFCGYIILAKKVLKLGSFYPKSNTLLSVSAGLHFVFIAFLATNNQAIGIPIQTINVFGMYIVCLTAAYKIVYKKKYQPAKYFFIGNASFFVIGTIANLQLSRALPDLLFGLSALEYHTLASLVEVSLFSLSIGAKIKEVQKELSEEKIKQEQIKLEEEEKRRMLIERQNADLEGIVELRTRELLASNEEIIQQSEEIAAQRDGLQQSYENVRLISDIGKEITRYISVETIISAVYAEVNKLMPADGFGIGVFNEKANRIEFPSYIERNKKLPFFSHDLNIGDSFSDCCFAQRKEILVGDQMAEYGAYLGKPPVAMAGELAVSVIYLPLIVQGKMLGITTVQSFQQNAYDENHLNLFRNIALYTAIALDNARLYDKTESLLLNILPKETAYELKEKGRASTKHYEKVTVLFTDFKGFTLLAEKMHPEEVVENLNHCFTAFDRICKKHQIEKIKTIGDSYMCAAGIPVADDDNPERMVEAALEMLEFMKNWKAEKKSQGVAVWDLRMGMHTGPVLAGVVGEDKFAYDIWGDTVNTASRMESSGEPSMINISEATFQLVKHRYHCTYRGKVQAKNKGAMGMYFLSVNNDG